MTSARPRIQSLIYEVTQSCNHACLYCYNVWKGHQRLPYPLGQASISQTLQLLAKALDETICSHVTLTGGEPLLHPNLDQILEFLMQRHVRVTLISNGHLLDEQKTAILVRGGVGLFEIPLLSHHQEIHDDLSYTPGAWEAALTAMSNIRLQHGKVVVAFVATRKNIEHLEETIRLAFAFGAEGIMLNRFNPGGAGRDHLEELLPSIEQVRAMLEVAEIAAEKYGLPISCSIPIQPCLIDTSCFPQLGFGFCAAGSEAAYYTLDPMGNLRPCNHTDIILGNLFESHFSDLINGEIMVSFANAIPAFCSDCERRQECQGGCKACAQVCYGSLTNDEPFLRQRDEFSRKAIPLTTLNKRGFSH